MMRAPERRVAIVGFAETWKDAPYDDPGVSICGLNDLYRYAPRFDEWYELHDEESLGLTKRVGTAQAIDEVKRHREWLRRPHEGKTIWMQKRFCTGEFPAAVEFPLEELQRRFATINGGRYFTSTVAFMLAHTLMRGRNVDFEIVDPAKAACWIGLFGIELVGAREYEDQRPCVEHLIGFAQGKGVEVYVPERAALMKSDHMYGFERPPSADGPVNRQRVEARLAKLRKQHDELVTQINKLKGAITESANWLTVFEGSKRGVTKLPESFIGAKDPNVAMSIADLNRPDGT